MDIKELGEKLSIYERIDIYDLEQAGQEYEFCFVTELVRDGKKYEAWQIHERVDNRAGKLIKDRAVYEKVAEKLLKQFPNFDITVTSRKYKYAPEMQEECLLCIPVEIDEFYHFMVGDKFKIEGVKGICTIKDYDERTQTYDYETEDGNILSFNSDDMSSITLLESTNEEWCYVGGGSWEIELPSDIIDSICHSGENLDDVEAALKDERVRKELDRFTDEEIDKFFDYTSLDMTDEEKATKTRHEKERYIVWDAAYGAFDDPERITDEEMNFAIDLYKKNGMLFLDDEDGKKAYDILYRAGYTLKQDGDVAHCIELNKIGAGFIKESVEDEVKDHENLAPEVNAEKLAKEIENQKDEKPKMATGHKKVWKEIAGKIELDKEEKNITKQVEESIASRIVSELDKINEDDIAVFNGPDEELYEVSAKIVKYPTGYYINFLDGKDGNGNLISQAGSYESEEEAREMLKKLRTDYKEI